MMALRPPSQLFGYAAQNSVHPNTDVCSVQPSITAFFAESSDSCGVRQGEGLSGSVCSEYVCQCEGNQSVGSHRA